MKQRYSPKWKGSRQKRKRVKYQINAPLHIKQKFVSAPLSEELAKKYNKKTIQVRKGDKVKILRGQFKKKTGRVEQVLLRRSRICIEGIQNIRNDGTKSFYPIHASNVIVTELYLEDKLRKKSLEVKNG